VPVSPGRRQGIAVLWPR